MRCRDTTRSLARSAVATLALAANALGSEPTQSEREHVAPPPPGHPMHEMTYPQMAAIMAMDDRARYSKVTFDELDWRDTEDGSIGEWDVTAWYGGDYHKLWLESQGGYRSGEVEDARAELLWDRIFSRWFSVQAGVRRDFGEGPSPSGEAPARTWAAVGVQGVVPYFVETEVTAYVAEGGRTALAVSAEHDLLLTQRLVLQSDAELDFYGKEDARRGIGSGLSHIELALRLRYEIRRELAPYLGLAWVGRVGESADLARAAGEGESDLQVLVGLRIWF